MRPVSGTRLVRAPFGKSDDTSGHHLCALRSGPMATNPAGDAHDKELMGLGLRDPALALHEPGVMPAGPARRPVPTAAPAGPSARAFRAGGRCPGRKAANHLWTGWPVPTASPAPGLRGPSGDPRRVKRWASGVATCRYSISADEGFRRQAAGALPVLGTIGGRPDLAHEQLLGGDQSERRPRGYHPAGGCRLGDSNVRGKARHAAAGEPSHFPC
jgi:hypothetical protein